MAVQTKHDKVAQRAYELYSSRGYSHGQDLDDWLTAEAELAGKTKPPARKQAGAANGKAQGSARAKTRATKKN
jgi:hypothetical protein